MKKGDFVRINYIGRLESGEIFDLTDEAVAKKEGLYNSKIVYKPMPVIVGEGFMLPGIDKALLSIGVGEKKEVALEAEEGFGQRDARLVRTLPKKVFRDQRVEPRPGMVVEFANTRGRIQSVTSGRIRVDFNNPLAGKKLLYAMEITEKIEDPVEKIKALLEFFGAKGDVQIEGGEARITARLPQPLRERVSELVMRNMQDIKKISFIESYEKEANESAENKSN